MKGFIMMKTIKTIDLWTEQHENHYECFNGPFVMNYNIHLCFYRKILP